MLRPARAPGQFEEAYDLRKRDPALHERRMRGGATAEKEPAQRVVMVFASLGFSALLVVPALDRRFHWSAVPTYIVLAADVLVAGLCRVSAARPASPRAWYLVA